MAWRTGRDGAEYKRPVFGPSLYLFILAFAACAGLRSEPLHSPWESVAVPAQNDTPYSCPAEAALPRAPSFEGYYTDAHHSIKDPAAEQAYRSAVSGSEDFARKVVRAADEYRAHGSEAAGRCATALLSGAAAQQAFTEAHAGLHGSRQGFYVQTWLCAGLSLAYLKVEGTGGETSAQHEAITAWLGGLAEHVQSFQNDLVRLGTTDGRNNHHSWAGLAVAAAGIAADRKDLFEWGINAGRDGIRQITAEGTLPLEMERASMARHYHLFAAAALVLLAELGEANGIDLYDERDRALRRLVLRAASGLTDPSFFAERTHVPQVPQDLASAGTLLWAAPFARRFPNPNLDALLAKTPQRSYWMFGGAPPP